MKNKIKKLSMLLLSIFIIISLKYSYAVTVGSFSISASNNSLTVGTTATITITVSNCEGQFSISSSNANVVSVSSASEWVENSKTITITAKSVGTATITVTATDVGDNQVDPEDVTGSKTVNITVTEANNSNGSTGGNGNTGTTSTPTPTEPKFTSVNKTVYATGDINLRSSWSTSSSATQIKKDTELTLIGTSTEKVNGYVWYKVSYNGQTKYVAKDLITEIKPEENKDNNANLKNLSIEVGKLSPAFNADVTEYVVELTNYEEKEIKVTAEAEDENATVKIEGNNDLKIGENKITITVTAKDGTTKTYNITATVTKEEKLALKSLKIKDIELKEFDPLLYEYEIDFEELEKLEIEAIANKEGATIEIIGNENLIEGKNTITIMVTSQDGEEIVTYQISANKIVKKQQEEITKHLNVKSIILSLVIAIVILIIIIILIIKYIKQEQSNIEYVYEDNLKDKDENSDEQENNKKDEEDNAYNEENEKEDIDNDFYNKEIRDLSENDNDLGINIGKDNDLDININKDIDIANIAFENSNEEQQINIVNPYNEELKELEEKNKLNQDNVKEINKNVEQNTRYGKTSEEERKLKMDELFAKYEEEKDEDKLPRRERRKGKGKHSK